MTDHIDLARRILKAAVGPNLFPPDVAERAAGVVSEFVETQLRETNAAHAADRLELERLRREVYLADHSRKDSPPSGGSVGAATREPDALPQICGVVSLSGRMECNLSPGHVGMHADHGDGFAPDEESARLARRCRHCGGPHQVSESVAEESPNCAACLNARIAERAAQKPEGGGSIPEEVERMLKGIGLRGFADWAKRLAALFAAQSRELGQARSEVEATRDALLARDWDVAVTPAECIAKLVAELEQARAVMVLAQRIEVCAEVEGLESDHGAALMNELRSALRPAGGGG